MKWEANRKYDHDRAGEPRWSEEAIAAVGGESQVKRAGGISDYQGWGALLTHDNRVLAWYYGSCGGCDAYEDLGREKLGHQYYDLPYEERRKVEFNSVVESLRNDIETFASAEAAEARFVEAIECGW